ncbi:MAG: hypothetical protein H0T71_06370, partial [Acidobacteria bacterium]|nr:hypothetical protein [Acidobacteriota bacterium]
VVRGAEKLDPPSSDYAAHRERVELELRDRICEHTLFPLADEARLVEKAVRAIAKQTHDPPLVTGWRSYFLIFATSTESCGR